MGSNRSQSRSRSRKGSLGSGLDSAEMYHGDGAGATEDRSSGSKRRRVAVACSACRIRKSRCNGARPRCDLCDRMGFECTYDMPESTANFIIRKETFNNLESRLRSLEEVVKRHDNQLSTRDHDSYNGSALTPLWDASSLPSRATVPPGVVVVDVPNQVDPQQPIESTGTDGMAIAFVDEQDCGFFGPSSNISLMRVILRALVGKEDASDLSGPSIPRSMGLHHGGMMNLHPPQTQPPEISQPSQSSQWQNDSNILPPDVETEYLIDKYFSNTGLLFPYIHEQSFKATYREVKESGFRHNVRRTWLALLNMILAMATCADVGQHDASQATADSDVFYHRASELCKTQMLRGTTLETVQYLLLTGQYLQGTQKAVQTWTTHGLAVKAALSIGLHSREASKKFPTIEQEMRKRTWYGCVVLDRSLSMTFGRPSTIPEDYLRLDIPRPVTGDRDNGMAVQFFIETIRLYKVLWKIMGSLYSHNLEYEELPETYLITKIFQLEYELTQWQASLPDDLLPRASTDLPQESPGNLTHERFRIVLSLRHLNTQLLLHRPVLTRLLQACFVGDENSQESTRRSINQVQRNFTTSCFKAAVEIVSIIHAVITRRCLGKHLLGAWWFTLYYVFNASLVAFGTLLLPVEDGQSMALAFASSDNQDEGTQTLAKAIQALMELGTGNPLVERCVDYLQELRRLLENKILHSCIDTNSATKSIFPLQNLPFPTGISMGEENSMMMLPFLDHHSMFEDDVSLGLLFNNEY